MFIFFDLALHTGWAAGDVDGGKPLTGLITLPAGVNGRHGHTFEIFRTALQSLVGRFEPRLIGYEAPIASLFHGGSNLDATRILITLAGITEMVAYQAGVPYRPLSIGTIRKEFCGHGHAKKPMVLKRCRELGWDTGGDDNRADAAAGWCALHRLNAGERRPT